MQTIAAREIAERIGFVPVLLAATLLIVFSSKGYADAIKSDTLTINFGGKMDSGSRDEEKGEAESPIVHRRGRSRLFP